jgi:hypothetical protein
MIKYMAFIEGVKEMFGNFNKNNLVLVKYLKACIEMIHSEYEVDMLLKQPGFVPISVIGQEDKVIAKELANNALIILNSINPNNFQLGYFETMRKPYIHEWLKLLGIANNTEEVIEFMGKTIDMKLQELYLLMLINYIIECSNLIGDLCRLKTIKAIKLPHNSVNELLNPQTISKFIIMRAKGDPNDYYTMAAVLSHLTDKDTSKINTL